MKPTPPQTESVQALWRDYLATLGEKPESTGKKYTAWHFCETKESATELAALVLQGIKRATAGSVQEYECAGDPIPHVGELSVVTDGDGIARCVIRTTRIDIVAYRDVTAEFAHTEGEGDRSLEFWRRVHWEYYGRILEPHGLQPTEDMDVVCERFDVIYSPALVDPVESWNAKAKAWNEQVGEDGDMNRLLNSDPVLWNFAGEVDGQRVLDAGCGTGYLSRELTRRGASVVGVDFSPAMVAIAQERAAATGLEIDHRLASASCLFGGEALVGLEPHSFDLAISNYVLMDLPDLSGAVESLARALRPGGVAILIFSHPCFPQGEGATVDEDPRSSGVNYQWSSNYFESAATLEPAWGRFDSAFPCYHRPLSVYFRTFTGAGFTVTDLEEPRLEPERFHLVGDDTRRLHRSRLLPYSIAFRLQRNGLGI
ncbi:MAG: hypothetical protein ACI9X4_000206 [Glaciecola sp.]|jgi:uncharacterized protein YhfF/ubiquinone/menaquinone biosynthesis C-methylase UbiE